MVTRTYLTITVSYTAKKNITLLQIKSNELRGFGTQDAIFIQSLATKLAKSAGL